MAHGEAVGVEAVVEPVGPLAERDAVVLALVEEAAVERLRRATEAVEVLVEEGQPALVLGHEREARAVDDVA